MELILLIIIIIIIGIIISKLLKNGGVIFILLYGIFMTYWYLELRWHFEIGMNVAIVIGAIVVSYLISLILKNIGHEMKKRKIIEEIEMNENLEKEKKQETRETRDDLLVRLQKDENDYDARIKLGKILVNQYFSIPEENRKRKDIDLLKQAEVTFKMVSEKGEKIGYISLAKLYETRAELAFKDSQNADVFIFYEKSAENYIKSGEENFILRGGELYYKLVNIIDSKAIKFPTYEDNDYEGIDYTDIYHKKNYFYSAKEAYKMIADNGNVEAIKRLGEMQIKENIILGRDSI